MNKEELIERMYECIDSGNMKCFKEQVEFYLEICDTPTASKELSIFLFEQYTASRADSIAQLMEIIIQCNPEIATVNYPDNNLFRLVVAAGSEDLLDCYLDEGIEPFLEDSTEEEYGAYFKKLLHFAAELNTKFSDEYDQLIKGMDYNGIFSNEDGIVKMHLEDYEIMQDTIRKYNAIIGRRNVIKTLMVNSGMDL